MSVLRSGSVDGGCRSIRWGAQFAGVGLLGEWALEVADARLGVPVRLHAQMVSHRSSLLNGCSAGTVTGDLTKS